VTFLAASEQLTASLERVLASVPVLGGRLCLDSNAIVLAEDDTVPLTFGYTATTLEEWMKLGHGVDVATGRPELLPLFDALPEDPWSSRTPMARIRVTFLEGGGTWLGVNISHAAGDGASCIRFVYCWGRQHRGLPYPAPSNDRALVTVNGMLTREKADLINLRRSPPAVTGAVRALSQQGVDHSGARVFAGFRFFAAMVGIDLTTGPDPEAIPHGFLLLEYSREVLLAMKSYGQRHCAQAVAAGEGEAVTFVSTNDMVTSAGWIMMRQLSGNADHSMNIVVNIRGRGDTANFGVGAGNALFGNGFTAATAVMPASPTVLIGAHHVSIGHIAVGARAARRALALCYAGLPGKLRASRRGAPELESAVGGAFCTTSWHFPLWELDFDGSACADEVDAPPAALGAHRCGDDIATCSSAAIMAVTAECAAPFEREGCVPNQAAASVGLVAFHGQPVHPLPPGETFAGIVVPTAGDQLDYQLYMPHHKMADAKRLHEEACDAFILAATERVELPTVSGCNT
jgi:hypothetical protein